MSDAPLLELEDVHAFYGSAHILEGVSFSMGTEAIALIGRNGMGKSTLCNTIMGLCRETRGSIRVAGREVRGRLPFVVAGEGVGYVPQGRRLFASLSVDEHLKMIRAPRKGRWNPAAVYELFPRLAERKRIGATQLSGGEQQMLAIGRALLLNPQLLVMDEPSEGLAPTIVESVIETCHVLVGEGMGILLVEQNLGVATSVAERQLVMVSGQIAAETTADKLRDDPDAQRRFLGVESTSAA
jgi:branched-chain amino acid transport system ATP-binding protein